MAGVPHPHGIGHYQLPISLVITVPAFEAAIVNDLTNPHLIISIPITLHPGALQVHFDRTVSLLQGNFGQATI